MATTRTLLVTALAALTLTACSNAEPDTPTAARYLASQPDSGPAGGEIDDRIGLDNTDLPALARLDPVLLMALQSAAADATSSGVDVYVTSGWRSASYQQRLFDEAVTRYGSTDEARRWVQTPNNSKHVTGRAVDVGPTDAADWMIQHGSDYGLCQTYANEMWHFEMATTAGGTCPAPLDDPSEERSEGRR